MRQIDPKTLQERKQKILQAVIHHFIKTGRPVGSNMLTEGYDFDLSPATIRNLMAELEEEGFLTHPHTSAGRIPTDRGYRLYVDSLIELQRMVLEEEDRVRREYDNRIRELEEMLMQTSRVLSSLSQYGGFVLTPKQDQNKLKYLELLPISENKILVILVTHTGMVRHRMIEARISRENLAELNRVLNSRLRGVTLAEARTRVVEEINDWQRQERELLALAQNLSSQIFDFGDEIYLQGASNVLTVPEFRDYEPMRSLLRITEDREMLKDLFAQHLHDEGVNVMIGAETRCKELKDLSVVSTVYKIGDTPVGVLGVIGPKRMEYQRMIALVDAVSKIVNRMMSEMGG